MSLRQVLRDALAGHEPERDQLRPVGCPHGCGRVFASASLIPVHGEVMPDGQWRCFPEERILGELRQVDGVYVLPGSDYARH